MTMDTGLASLGLEEIFRRFAEEAGVPGLAFGVVAGGRLVHQGQLGMGDYAGGQAVREDTAFRIASMTK
ncbi:MAG: serine hydrolase, partial [Candidatus Dormibacteria bacterium]